MGEGRKLLLKAQEEAGLQSDFCLVAVVGGQRALLPPSDTFYKRVDWDENLPQAWHPAEDRKSPVRMRPDNRFGLPAVGGAKTETISGNRWKLESILMKWPPNST